MQPSSPDGPHWPAEIVRLHAALKAADGAPARDRYRGALWRLLIEALTRFLRGHARRAGAWADAEIEDIAAEKALGMLARAESGAWDVAGRTPGEIVQYVSHAARNGWLDHASRSRREVLRAPAEGEEEVEESGAGEIAPATSGTTEGATEARELALALRSCVERLPERERRVWFFRAYYEMSSRAIADHPLVQVRVAHVDVINQRARDALRACMRGKGHDLVGFPPEAFVELWEALEGLAHGFPPPSGRLP
jgi:RNA polymerase sigma factor (sigma-70 family)